MTRQKDGDGKCPFVGDSCGFTHWKKALGMYIFDDPLCEPADMSADR